MLAGFSRAQSHPVEDQALSFANLRGHAVPLSTLGEVSGFFTTVQARKLPVARVARAPTRPLVPLSYGCGCPPPRGLEPPTDA